MSSPSDAVPSPDAPFFSVIVPVHNVRAYLRESLASVLGQSFGDLELIAIDDASPDGSGEILDEVAATDDRMRVVHLEHNVGLGPARNVGLDHARGRYLLFLDSDDTMTPGALAATKQRIDDTGEPDIVFFDYARTYWWGAVNRNVMAPVIQRAKDDLFTIDKHPDLLKVLMVVWNKAYRRDWVTERGLRFHPGYYEDLPWTYPALLSASRIAVLDRVNVHYRQRRHGNILRSRNEKHFDVFDQYRRIFDHIDAHPDLERWRGFMFDRMLAHYLSIMRAKNRLVRSQYHAWFERIVDAYRTLQPAGYSPPRGRAGAKLQAIRTGNYPAFLAAHYAGSAVRRARSPETKERVRQAKRSVILGYYAAQRKQPIDEHLAVYSAQWSTAYTGNPRAIYEQAKRFAPDVQGVWVVKRDERAVIPDGVPVVLQGGFPYYRAMARAKYFFNDVNFDDDIVKRPGQVHVQTKHGTPLKKMGLELQDHPVGAAGMRFRALLQRSDRWDYVISSNRHSSEVWERSFPCDYVTLETGYPRNDRLVLATPAERAELRARFGIGDGVKAILYAPTFRDWSRKTFTPPVDLAQLAEALGDGWTIFVRTHYLTEGDASLARLTKRGLIRDATAEPDLEGLMIASDVLLTDYSSIQFDYANLDRPIVIYADDWAQYAELRGVTFDLLASPPGVVAQDMPALIDAFTSGRWAGPDATDLRKAFARRFCPWDDGHAGERVIARVMGDSVARTDVHSTGVAELEEMPEADATPELGDVDPA
ncbi:MAG: bifunctional glycosyltransferase/CDP-glycerol:glycerophosphate glycerophosphotransferase [Jatrophihabitans sp.]|uniref:bifunctional glycosyltransferase/CDP-glycerol:glycerophosphate glycerophosphotransferase n=1 Tax=Jatrophihabitans sp. TaxID=1932789 RepID=UPI003F7EC077